MSMTIDTLHGTVALPAFFPDGTRGVVRSVDSADLDGAGVPGIVMNTFHLATKPGPGTVKSVGGLHTFCNWNKPILTDSGGFQAFSLIRENKKFGEVQSDKIVFIPEGQNEKVLLSPEKCIQSQFSFGSDIMMCLDYCTHPDDPDEVNITSVDITIAWARKCKNEYLSALRSRKIPTDSNRRPMLFAIIQGGRDHELRKKCADALIEIGFDGYGFGGFPLDGSGQLIMDTLRYTADLMPDNLPKYAMGVGKPDGIVACAKMGYNLFDCVIPTRDARHNRLYVFNEDYNSIVDINLDDKFFINYYILDDKHHRDSKPVSQICDCHCCRNYSRAYLRHLCAIGDTLGARLATIHNLRFYSMLMDAIRRS